MEKLCPITYRNVDENVARTTSGVVVLLYGLFFLTRSPFIVTIIFLDFVIRGFWDSSYSPIAMFSKYLMRRLGVKPKPVNAGPKIFAGQVGTFLTAAVLVCSLTNFSSLGCYFAGILVFFALLESTLSYCVACKLYPFFRRIK